MKIKIYYEDTDCGGIVYHTNYLKYTERARSEYFSNLSKEVFKPNQGFVLRDCECRFFASARLLDEVVVKSKILKIKSASIKLEQEIFKDELLLFRQTTTLAYVKDGKLAQIDDEFIKILNKRENGIF